MSDLVWGASIAVDGVRPEWLKNNEWDIVTATLFDGDVQTPNDETNPNMDDWGWGDIESICLPADHPHYTTPPAINWDAPIEAVHEDGRVQSVVSKYKDNAGDHMIHAVEPIDDDWVGGFHRHNGVSALSGDKWRIRNVTPTTPTIAPEHVARMVALVERMAGEPKHLEGPWVKEARAILSAIKPTHPDTLLARKVCDETLGEDGFASGECDSGEIMRCAVAAIRTVRGEGV